MSIETIIGRQFAIANNQADDVQLPKQRIYAMCNLRGGIGKTTLTFNLSYLVDNLLAVDTCPQGNLSFFLIIIIMPANKQMLKTCCYRIWFRD